MKRVTMAFPPKMNASRPHLLAWINGHRAIDGMDFRRATRADLWAVPIVSYAEWSRVHDVVFKAKGGQIVQSKTPLAKQGTLTANATTPCAIAAIAFAGLTHTGALIFEVPEGSSAGVIDDMWSLFVDTIEPRRYAHP